MRGTSALGWLGAAILATTFSAPALAWEPMRVSGVETSWPSERSLVLCVGDGLSAPTERIVAAGIWWSDGGVRVPFELDSAAACTRDETDGRVSATQPATWSPTWGDDEVVVAFTIHTLGSADATRPGRPTVDADLVFNSNVPSAVAPDAQTIDLRWVMAHEMGHVLGIGHTCGDPAGALPSCTDVPPDRADDVLGALMAPTSTTGVRLPSLSADDLAALRALHPTTEPPIATDACIDDVHILTEVDQAAVLCPSDGGSVHVSPAVVPACDQGVLVATRADGASTVRLVAGLPSCPPKSDLESPTSDVADIADATADAATPPATDDAPGESCACAAVGPTPSTPNLPSAILLLVLIAFPRAARAPRGTA